MEYKLKEESGKIIIENLDHFEPKHVFECGQCFRWNEEEDGSYTGVAHGKVVNVKKENNNIIFSNINKKDFEEIWYNYFDLDRDYGKIKEQLSKDKTLKEAIKFGYGIRVLKQDPWEILISFIISANNRIPMIKRAIEKLSEKYGEFIEEYKGRKYYSFPSADKLDNLTVEDIKACGTGFRAKYIQSAAIIVSSSEIDIYAIKNLSTENARKELMLFSGVGPKVSDCIMLFSMNKDDAFPIDVWVKRVMEYFYVDDDTKLKDIQKFAQDKFEGIAGFAQQYLFYYARELGIGRKKK
ncbi:DNA-3-methyladenine glycosylase family protein [Sporosalibacterium faouarense]|uniref:DNA-3-methyladenine glycosylase family protein n=1 Tax=Sporosalibacterium faouarense TaxID=516123 RepID=UPI00141C2D5F|nr:DNA glycosylase [Sporosalibacterium faouarense]MTI46750.1 DNA-3-methyladenine glycosylase 2 [Bacillota bacterium]